MDMIIFAETIPVMNTHLSNEHHVEKEELAQRCSAVQCEDDKSHLWQKLEIKFESRTK